MSGILSDGIPIMSEDRWDGQTPTPTMLRDFITFLDESDELIAQWITKGWVSPLEVHMRLTVNQTERLECKALLADLA